jgi:hypothetical protein
MCSEHRGRVDGIGPGGSREQGQGDSQQGLAVHL